MATPRELAHDTFGRIVDRFGLDEVCGPGAGSPRITLRSPSGDDAVGECRTWSGEPLDVLVYVGLEVDAMGLDSHMVFAFTAADSAVPHYTLDTVAAPGTHAFHLDLVPRVDLGAHLEYVRYCYDLLTETTLDVAQWDGLSPAALTPLQYAMASPWTLVSRATPETFARFAEPAGEYLDHWFALVEDGLPEHVIEAIDPTWLPERDRRLRAALFDPAVDPAWAQMDHLVGAAASAAVRALLRGDAD